ncbi:MAG: PAS domain-containing protein [Planctomycetota bacterium]|nr:MAG: PAS domain-containing protein [Planctomycetota bacterium]
MVYKHDTALGAHGVLSGTPCARLYAMPIGDTAAMNAPQGIPDFEAALRLFDETVRALEARARRLEEVLTVKQQELTDANRRLSEKVQELDRLSQYLELVLSSVASGVVAVDALGIITTVNPAARRMYAGLDRALEGCQLAELFPDSAVGQVLAGAAGPLTGYRQVAGRAGDQRQIEVVASPIVAPDGSVVGAVEVLDDVTDVRRLQDEVERGRRLKSLGEMAAGVAHEIRNPLNGIEGFASLLVRDMQAGSPSARHAQAIVSGVRDLNRTVTGLLQFTQQKTPNKRHVPMDELATAVCELVQAELLVSDERSISSADAAVTCVIAEDWHERRLHIDPSQIRQVLLNLLQNAVHAAQDQQQANDVRVELRLGSSQQREKRYCLLEIADNGAGINDAHQADIFTPFFTTKDHGTGLGLAIVHSIVQLHDGSIEVDRDPQLGGARFRMLLPESTDHD